MHLTIRRENIEDYHDSEVLIRESFFNVYMPGAEEHYLVHRLRTDNSYLKELSFVALDNNEIVGAIYYAKAKVINESNEAFDVLTFGPLGVKPSYQRKGVGEALVRHTLSLVDITKYKAIIITGVPAYYPRFGFKPCFDLHLYMEGDIQFPALMGLELEKGFFKNNQKLVFYEPSVYLKRVSKTELEEFDKSFPYLKKEIRPGQWKPSLE